MALVKRQIVQDEVVFGLASNQAQGGAPGTAAVAGEFRDHPPH